MNPLGPHEIRIATILETSPLSNAQRPAYRLRLDLGRFGERTSSAQLTDPYSSEQLVGRQVLAVVSPPKRIAGYVSERLVLGVEVIGGGVVLIQPDMPVENANIIF